MKIIDLIKSITNAISNYFSYKTISYKDDTIEYIDKQIENVKNEIVKELNRDNTNLYTINRLYSQLRKLSKRKTKL